MVEAAGGGVVGGVLALEFVGGEFLQCELKIEGGRVSFRSFVSLVSLFAFCCLPIEIRTDVFILSTSPSFFQGVDPSIFDPGVDMIELRAFYELLSILPSELGQAVVKGLEGLLRRPRRRFDSGLGPQGLSWVSSSPSRRETRKTRRG